jgi:hypothetical protein
MEHVRWVLSNLQPADWAQIAGAVVAGATVVSKGLEIIIRGFPQSSKVQQAEGVLAGVVSGLSKLQASPVLQALAMSPKPGAPSHPLPPATAPTQLQQPKPIG